MAIETARGTIDVSKSNSINLLHSKAVGLAGVLFLTVTGAAPMSAMLFNVPIAAGYGIGNGTPAAFLVATIVLLIFSVGYAAMASVSAVGGFYSFISHGLGREVGMRLRLRLGGLPIRCSRPRCRAASPISPIRRLQAILGHQHALARSCALLMIAVIAAS